MFAGSSLLVSPALTILWVLNMLIPKRPDVNIPIFFILYFGYKIVKKTKIWKPLEMDFVTVRPSLFLWTFATHAFLSRAFLVWKRPRSLKFRPRIFGSALLECFSKDSYICLFCSRLLNWTLYYKRRVLTNNDLESPSNARVFIFPVFVS